MSGKKYVKIEVSKQIYSEIYIEYDEDDPRFQGITKVSELKISGEETLVKLAAYSQSMKNLQPHLKPACKTLKDYEWDTDEENIEINCLNPCEEEEAKQFSYYQIPEPPKN